MDSAPEGTAPWDEAPGDGAAGADVAVSDDARPTPPRRKSDVSSVLTGDILSKKEVRRAYPYMIFVAALMFFYIANAFRSQHIHREHAALTEQVKALRARSMIVASEKMQATRQSKIMSELARRGIPLRESLTPNKVIPADGTPAENDR
jgi:hypothetical protein